MLLVYDFYTPQPLSPSENQVFLRFLAAEKKLLAINLPFNIMNFMNEYHTIRSPQKAVLGLDILLLRRKAL